MINANALRNPRTQWEIEAAMWRALQYGAAIAVSAKGTEILSVIHDRKQVPAFSFYRATKNVTEQALKALRSI